MAFETPYPSEFQITLLGVAWIFPGITQVDDYVSIGL